jgi:hypothetical protein
VTNCHERLFIKKRKITATKNGGPRRFRQGVVQDKWK